MFGDFVRLVTRKCKIVTFRGNLFLQGMILSAIVKACPLLERFSVEIGGSTVSQDISNGDLFTPGDVMRALRTRKQTLKQLDLHLKLHVRRVP